MGRIYIVFGSWHFEIFAIFSYQTQVKTRSGVEDTRLEAKAKDSLSEDRHSRGQGQECSRPRPRTKDTSVSALQKKKKKVFTKIFQAISTKKRFPKIFQALHKILTIQKILLSSSRGQANFRGLEASRPRPRTSKSVLEDVLEAKDVLEDSTSGENQKKSYMSAEPLALCHMLNPSLVIALRSQKD